MKPRKTGRAKFSRYKSIIALLVSLFSLFPSKINFKLLLWNRNRNGIFGLLLRYVLIRNLAKDCGDNVSIHPGVYLFNLQNMKFGDNVSIHPMCYLDAAGEILIGDNVSIAHSTSILSTNHTWDNIDLPIKYNKETFSKVVINSDVWIGCGVRILAGVTIASRSVVAAGAVVTKSVEPNSLIGGIPGRKIKEI